MEQNQRPHSRQKTVGSGAANVGRESQFGGSGPVGAGGRNGGSQSSGGYSQGQSYPSVRLSPKRPLALILVAVIAFCLLKSCGSMRQRL